MVWKADKQSLEPILSQLTDAHINGILPKGPYPPCLRMAERALLAGYPRYAVPGCSEANHYLVHYVLPQVEWIIKIRNFFQAYIFWNSGKFILQPKQQQWGSWKQKQANKQQQQKYKKYPDKYNRYVPTTMSFFSVKVRWSWERGNICTMHHG